MDTSLRRTSIISWFWWNFTCSSVTKLTIRRTPLDRQTAKAGPGLDNVHYMYRSLLVFVFSIQQRSLEITSNSILFLKTFKYEAEALSYLCDHLDHVLFFQIKIDDRYFDYNAWVRPGRWIKLSECS